MVTHLAGFDSAECICYLNFSCARPTMRKKFTRPFSSRKKPPHERPRGWARSDLANLEDPQPAVDVGGKDVIPIHERTPNKREGDVRRAKEHAEAAEETRAWGSDAWNAMADVAGACASGGEDGEAAELFATAAERFERIGQPYQAARCTLQAGLALVEGGDIRSGQVWLQRALDAFQRLGAATGEARARRALEKLSTTG